MLWVINVFLAFNNPFRFSPFARLSATIFATLLMGGVILLLVLLGAVRYVWRYARLRLRGGRRTGGKVVGHEYIHNESTGRYYYHAVIEFSTVEARMVRFTSEDGRDERQPRVGERVALMYDPTNPADVLLL